MIQPTIIYEAPDIHTSFDWDIPSGISLKVKDVIVNIPASTSPFTRVSGTVTNRGWVAVRHEGIWKIEDASIHISTSLLSVLGAENVPHEAMAFPIDPRMKRQDIAGATKIYPNSDNTGWLFAHAEVGDHHERIIKLEAIMHTLFEDLVHSNLEDVLKKVVGGNNPSPQLGTELLYNYNSQFGALSNYSNIVEFRKECVKWCSEVEKLLHVGQHIQEDDLSIKHQLVRAIKQAKLIWNADTGKARILATIASQVDAIIARVEADHEIETRWVKKARLDAEAKKRASAEAEASDDSSENQ